MIERSKFHNKIQEVNKTIIKFVTTIKVLSEQCNFGISKILFKTVSFVAKEM